MAMTLHLFEYNHFFLDALRLASRRLYSDIFVQLVCSAVCGVRGNRIAQNYMRIFLSEMSPWIFCFAQTFNLATRKRALLLVLCCAATQPPEGNLSIANDFVVNLLRKEDDFSASRGFFPVIFTLLVCLVWSGIVLNNSFKLYLFY